MISKALQLMFFWRRNHLPSIAFKAVFWGGLAWLAVGMFTNVRLALIAAAVIACMSAVKYGLKNRSQAKKLLAMCDGDPQKYAALQAKLNTPGMGGTLLREMINAELEDDDDQDDEENEPLSEEEQQAIINANAHLIRKMSSLTCEAKLATAEQCEEVQQELLDAHDEGLEHIDMEELISAFLPDNVICIMPEDYIDEDDHAALVEEFSSATNERWVIENCSSQYDEDAERWVVSFSENGNKKTWRFAQSNDYLNQKFMDQLINYTQSKSGYTITTLDASEIISLACLPPGMFEALTDGEASSLAA